MVHDASEGDQRVLFLAEPQQAWETGLEAAVSVVLVSGLLPVLLSLLPSPVTTCFSSRRRSHTYIHAVHALLESSVKFFYWKILRFLLLFSIDPETLLPAPWAHGEERPFVEFCLWIGGNGTRISRGKNESGLQQRGGTE